MPIDDGNSDGDGFEPYKDWTPDDDMDPELQIEDILRYIEAMKRKSHADEELNEANNWLIASQKKLIAALKDAIRPVEEANETYKGTISLLNTSIKRMRYAILILILALAGVTGITIYRDRMPPVQVKDADKNEKPEQKK